MKKLLPFICMGICPLSAAAFLLHSLENYYSVVHNDSATIVCLFCIIAFAVSLIFWRLYRESVRFITPAFIVSTLLLCGVYYLGSKIPFCVECDHITADDLGILIHWIQPLTTP